MMRKLLTGLLIGLAAQIGYADTKISALSSTSTLNAGDIIPVVTNPGSSPANFSITKTNLNNTLNSWTTPRQSTFTYGLTVGSMTATSSATVNSQFTAGTYQGGGLTSCGSTSQAVSWGSGSYGCTTITAGGIGALTGNQNISISGDSSGSGTTAISLIAAATQGNITTFTSPITVTSSETVLGSGGLGVTFGVVASSVAASSMTASGQITAGSLLLNTPLPVAGGGTGTASPGLVPGTNITSITGTWPNQTINAATQSGGGGGLSALAVTSGTSAGFATAISSPTGVINNDQRMFGVSLQGGATAFVTITYSTQTASGNYTLSVSTSRVVMANCASACTITLPTAAGVSGIVYNVKIIGAGVATISTTSSQTIDGSTSIVPNPNQYADIEVISDGSNWEIL